MVKVSKQILDTSNVGNNAILAIKVLLIFFFLVSPFIPYQKVDFLNSIVFKVLILVAIVAVCFFDFQLAILLTLAFIILIINLNTNMITKAVANDHFTNFKNFVDGLQQQLPVEDPITAADNVQCTNPERNNMNDDLVHHYIDPKIKPYEVFINMLSDPKALNDAQNAYVLDPSIQD